MQLLACLKVQQVQVRANSSMFKLFEVEVQVLTRLKVRQVQFLASLKVRQVQFLVSVKMQKMEGVVNVEYATSEKF